MLDIVHKKRNRADRLGWALTLADMMTLLLCFFAVMFSVSTVDEERYEAVSQSMSEAMGARPAPQAVPDTAETPAMPQRPRYNVFALQLELARLIGHETDALDLKIGDRAVVIDLKGAVFFELGSAQLTPTAARILARLAPPLIGGGYFLTIEGHSDNLPIHSSQFPSNWELSSARASAVARFLIDKGFDPQHLEVVGLADTRPLAPNTDAQGNDIAQNQQRNRRVTILVKPMDE